jgi:holliday junction DNA helicase RuvA
MIGKLKGILDEVSGDQVLLDVGGVVYLVTCPETTAQALGSLGSPCTLFIETYVREDQFRLFGFASQYERDWFLLLQSVQGIGAKIALAILSKLNPGQLANAIALQDKVLLAKTPGVGPKAAERLVLELKGKAPKSSLPTGAEGQLPLGTSAGTPAVSDAISALANLGYHRDQAAAAIAAVIKDVGSDAPATILIRMGLRYLSAK